MVLGSKGTYIHMIYKTKHPTRKRLGNLTRRTRMKKNIPTFHRLSKVISQPTPPPPMKGFLSLNPENFFPRGGNFFRPWLGRFITWLGVWKKTPRGNWWEKMGRNHRPGDVSIRAIWCSDLWTSWDFGCFFCVFERHHRCFFPVQKLSQLGIKKDSPKKKEGKGWEANH